MEYTTQQNKKLNNKYAIDKLNPIHFVKKFLIKYEVKKNFRLNYGIRIADLGCGNGLISNELSKFGYVDAFDKDQSSLSIAKQNKVAGVKLFHKNIETLREKSVYDLVVCSEVLQYFQNDGEILKTISSILKPYGYLIITVPINKHFSTTFDKREKSKRYVVKELMNTLHNNDFSIVKKRYWGFPLLNLFYKFMYVPRSDKEAKNVNKEYDFSPLTLVLLWCVKYLFLFDVLFNNKNSFNLLVIARKNK
jgi:2-polyprenyl-3-methyl-5-hydroxy-6-metoxy-1,4-benzoquinol methylase